MARVAKIDNVWKKRFERQERKRAIDNRDKRVYFLIICEGEKTEPNYFIALEKELPIGTVKIEIDGVGRNTIDLVNYTLKTQDNASRKFDSVWVVFDKDDFPADNFNGAIIKAQSNNINCAWSNEAFELWFLLHFQYVNTALSRDEYKSYLEREIRQKSGNSEYEYRKNDPNTYLLLKEYGNQQQANDWADRLIQDFTDQRYAEHNPCTRVHELIDQLRNPQNILKKLDE